MAYMVELAAHTIPWNSYEFVVANGVNLIYDFGPLPGMMTIRLPGRGMTTQAELVASGAVVTMPKQIRKES